MEKRGSSLVTFALTCLMVGLGSGCSHGSGEWEPLATQTVYVADKFFDVAVPSAERAVIIGYGGKILETNDFGISWNQVESGTRDALYSIDFAADDPKVGWIVGQEGLILRTSDGGTTWERQSASAYMTEDCRDDSYRERNEDECPEGYLFATSVIDSQTVVAIGDRSLFVKTTDGGKTWDVSTIKVEGAEDEDDEWAIVFEDPVLYDVEFFDADNGFVVGEFGKIYRTEDGGQTWVELQEALMGGDIFDILDLPTFFDVHFSEDRQKAMAVGLDGRIAVTNDGGENWSFESNNVHEYTDPFYAATALPSGERWVVGSSGQVVRSKPGGTFEKGDLGSAINVWLRRVRFYDGKRGWIVGGFGLIMNTDDGGESWFRRIG